METLLLAIDVGNSRAKFGLFVGTPDTPVAGTLPFPLETWAVPHTASTLWERFTEITKSAPAIARSAAVAGVNPAGIERLLSTWPESLWPPPRVVRSGPELGLPIRVQFPERVGIDRLLNAVAANALRTSDQPAIVIDSGTATTIDLVAIDGAFEGGAILPGLELSARALHEYTALLPYIPPHELDGPRPPAPLGRNTREAIASGVYWGQIGAIKELVTRLNVTGSQSPLILLTGGAAAVLAPHLAMEVRVETDLPLKGLAMVAGTRGVP